MDGVKTGGSTMKAYKRLVLTLEDTDCKYKTGATM